MGFFNEYPYTNLHEINLDWIVSQITNLNKTMQDFIVTNKIKFANPIEWDSNNLYDESTIVLAPDGNSYISLKAVPKGINYNNTEYWEKIADFNAQLETLNNNVNTLNSNVNTLNSDVNALNSDVNTLNSNVNTLSNTVDTLNNNVDALNNTVDTLSEEVTNIKTIKYIFIGDSYGDGLTPNGNVEGWCALVPKYMNLNINDYISNAIGGSGFTAGKTFLELLRECVTRIDVNEVKEIVVCGGYNDNDSSLQTIENAIKEFCDYSLSTFRNAKIKIGCIGMSTNSTIRDKLNTVKYAYQKCSLYGASYLSNVEYILHDFSLMSSDTIHPTSNGYKVLSEKIVNAIIGNLSVSYPLKPIKMKSLGGGITNISGLPNTIMNNNTVTLIGSVVIINTVEFTLTGAQPLKVCSIVEDSYIIGSQFSYVASFECIGYIKNSSGFYTSCNFMCYFLNGDLWIEERDVEGAGFKNYPNTVDITLFIPTVVLPIEYC